MTTYTHSASGRSPEGFRDELRRRFGELRQREDARFPQDECLRMDLHCHDYNSDVPDEIVGRMIRSSETWVSSEQVLECQRNTGMDVYTITNHNNARSCWEQLDKGRELMPGAEWTCTVPEFDTSIHVLAWGFDPEDEPRLNRLRRNLYEFLDYTNARGIPTAWAHPLYVYGHNGIPPLLFWEKLSLVFQRFEVINGHRDAWQNLLLDAWLDHLDAERIEQLSRETGVSPESFCERPFDKDRVGGSDDHMAMFVGGFGTRLHVPGHQDLSGGARIEMARRALWKGRTAPFGRYSDEGRIAGALLDYYCQTQMHLKDAGLVRLLLHKGTLSKKLQGLVFANLIFELRRHKVTTRFIEAAHGALQGRSPGLITKLTTKKDYTPLLHTLEKIAAARRSNLVDFEKELIDGIPEIFRDLLKLLLKRLRGRVESLSSRQGNGKESPEAWRVLKQMEFPLYLRNLMGGEDRGTEAPGGISSLGGLMDGLPFPALAGGLIGAGQFSAARAMYANRPVLDQFAGRLDTLRHPQRALWLTDTLFDRNGVSRSLGLKLKEAQRRDLPVDFLAASGDRQSMEHLHVIRPLEKFTFSVYPDQPMRVFDPMEIHRIFKEGGYDRIVCSTELLMGPIALYLKQAFHVPAFFFVHTDWMEFARKALDFSPQRLDQLRRLLRGLYHQFDGIFVLNSEHETMLSAPDMGIPASRIHRTAHWADPGFMPESTPREAVLPQASPEDRLLLYAGRLSQEKGVLELPGILKRIREEVPAARLVFAGTGPAESALREACPDAIFLGWTDKERLAQVYNVCDLCLLPSRFDTFCCTLLEAQHCGLPVVAYSVMGPRDLVQDGRTGYLVEDGEEMAAAAVDILLDAELQGDMKRNAVGWAEGFRAETLMDDLLAKLGLSGKSSVSREDSESGLSEKKENLRAPL